MEESLTRSIGKALKHRREIIVTFTIAFSLSILTPVRIMKVNTDGIASLIFQVAGTVVPLALAAAGLSSTFVIKIATDAPDIFKEHEKFAPHERGRALIKRITELQEVLEQSWRATIFILISFVLATLTLLIPDERFSVSVFAIRVNLDIFLASLSISFILVGTFCFLPMIRYSFRGKVLGNLLQSAKRLREEGRPTIDEMLRDARALREKHPEESYLKISSKLHEKYDGRSFPLAGKLGFEVNAPGLPIEDATSGLSEIKRGIDLRDWKQICLGVTRTIEQEEAYKQVGGQGERADTWHDRSRDIKTVINTVTDKWLPDALKRDKDL